MHLISDIVAVLAGAALASAFVSRSAIGIQPSPSGRYIIELVGATSANSFEKRDVHRELFEQLDRRGVSWETGTRFESRLFNAVSITLRNGDDIEALHVMDVVKAIYPLRTFEPPRNIDKRIITRAPDDTNAPSKPRDSTHIMTGVDKLHAQGFKGKGVKIGIIDTGIDYTHPNLGGGIGEGKLVVGGYDFVGDDYDGANTPVPDSDPLDQCVGHGTHVAGIIGMQPGNEFGVSGVAYESTIMAYRTFGCSGGTSEDVTIAALLRAYDDGCDVITLSLGDTDGWSTGAGAVVASRIAAEGRVVTVAAGNDGQEGAWYTSTPANGLDVISVGSVDNTEVFYNALRVSGVAHEPIPYLVDGQSKAGFSPLNLTGELPLYALSTNLSIENDACEPLPASVPDLSKFITIIRRGTCTFSAKLANVAAKGGKAAIFANNDGVFGGVVFNSTVPAVMVDTADGDFLINQVKANVSIRISFPQEGGVVTIPSATGGLSSQFSTYGPTNDALFKPAVSAPGGNIMSTWPTTLGSWMVLSGTSMACPHVAGIAALLLQAKGKNAATAKSIFTLLQTTSSPILDNTTNTAPLNTLAQAGAGLVNVYNALSYKTELSAGQFELNDTANWKADHTFQIKNTGSGAVTYRISHVPGDTVRTIEPSLGVPIPFPLPITSDVVGVKLSTQSVVVPPGETTTVTVKFTPPAGADAKTYPVLSGHIQVEGGSETLKVSYIGIAGNLKDIAVIDGSTAFFETPTPLLLNSQGKTLVPGTEFTLAGDDTPTLRFRLAFGTPRLVADLVSKDLRTRVTIQPSSSIVRARADETTFDSIPIIGRITEVHYLPRSSFNPEAGFIDATMPSKFSNGTSIPPGEYRILLRAQHVATDPSFESSYDVFMSNWFKVIKT